MKTAYLLLEDGTAYKGYAMGAERDLSAGEAIGEVVFNTDMTTSQDLLQDPTYSGQIVVQTYPLIGNRGVDPVSPSKFVASGYVVREWCVEPTDAHEFVTLDDYLRGLGIAGLCGVDTRRPDPAYPGSRRHERHDRGHARRVARPDCPAERLRGAGRRRQNHAEQASALGGGTPPVRNRHSGLRVPGVDPGAFSQAGLFLTLYPAYTPAADILAANPDGIVFSDGPGDPWDNPEIVEILRALADSGRPMFGWGLGHQLMAVAAGMEIEKLPVGHRGSNQPVRNLDNGRVMVTEQNHGYTVALGSVKDEVAEAFLQNVNDGTVEGLRYRRPILTVQFEPSDGNGYQDTAWVFDAFVRMLREDREKRG